jgi:hypothetical protein
MEFSNVLVSGYGSRLHQYTSFEILEKANTTQDSIEARFQPCALPFISAIPAAVAICIFCGLLLQLLPRSLRSPRWLRTFIKEPPEEREELTIDQKRPFGRLALILLAISLIGSALQTSTIFYPTFRVQMVLPAASWAAAAILVAISRPEATPKAILVLYCSILASQLVALTNGFSKLHPSEVAEIFVPFAAFGAIMIILFMPMRHPNLPNDQISPAFGPPTSQLRSPEDNFTLWQFMTVSWMSPLISLGNTRQLNNEDVWSLGYEFQHRGLHDRFRELQGSVFRRLLEATGVDLSLISILSIIELFASM